MREIEGMRIMRRDENEEIRRRGNVSPPHYELTKIQKLAPQLSLFTESFCR